MLNWANSQQAGLVECYALHCWSLNTRQAYLCTCPKRKLTQSWHEFVYGSQPFSSIAKNDRVLPRVCVKLAMLLTAMLYLKKAHISSSPVIDGLVTISHNGHPLTQASGGGIAGEGVQQPVLSMRYILELIQLHQKHVIGQPG